ncbi:Ankyrin repeat domain-containing protein [Plasmodiophora brassicae]
MVVPGQVELSQVVEHDGTMRASTSDEQAVLDMIRSDVPPDAHVLHGPMFTTQFQIGTDLYVPVTWAAANNANRVLQSMALARADLTICNARGMNALHEAARHACLPMCKVLIALGEYDINAAAANGKTALHFAAASGNRDLCRLLVDKGARTSCVTSLGRTAAHEAARMNRLPALQYLVERGQIDPEQPDTYRMWTALHLASSQGHTQICRYLVHRCRVRIDAPDKVGSRLFRRAVR